MKVLIIEFSIFNGIRHLHATHYYIDGKRVTRDAYYQSCVARDGLRHLTTRQWSDVNRHGARRDYTEIVYGKRENLTARRDCV